MLHLRTRLQLWLRHGPGPLPQAARAAYRRLRSHRRARALRSAVRRHGDVGAHLEAVVQRAVGAEVGAGTGAPSPGPR